MGVMGDAAQRRRERNRCAAPRVSTMEESWPLTRHNWFERCGGDGLDRRLGDTEVRFSVHIS